ncbi:geranylgeranyl transferase type-2 subunit alpha [Scaptodrosophila lebanonensis]|uniref:Geranylgeranyl transferase type-2 subunit alpha n=1 Tax=Drosophila lebanonensis TaxID=7225 RepID=A0A6J2TGC9_DROLE|nr:geranylgeranyl transferase type-2 subunit alpha [Scaptodrosophila lebanonensis]
MHGRIKVRTTEEERERKKKEHALKVRAYRAAMGRIQKKRAAGELEDDEMLTLTAQILLRNPDVTTLWNIRRECVLAKIAVLEKEKELEEKVEPEVAPADAKEDESTVNDGAEADDVKTDSAVGAPTPLPTLTIAEKLQAIFATEMGITEQCLMINPKSYNAWHHRCWTLEQNPQADWQREVKLCNTYLKYDERNFHTWDYRRYVTEKAQIAKTQELDFCTEKIKVNFSNYSSWHHRSLLLPVLYPYEGEVRPKRPMSEAKLKEELEMVLTAAFTDPNDSSAWFYQRWLLGNGWQLEQPTIVAFRCDAERAVLAFNKPNPHLGTLQLVSDGQKVELQNWLPVNDTRNIWQCSAEIGSAFELTKSYALQFAEKSLSLNVLPAEGLYYFQPPNASAAYTNEVLGELQSQLQSCLDLLEYEPDSKWTLLTSALLMRAIDADKHHAQSLEHLYKLWTIDDLRAGYYKDLAARWSLELALTKWPQKSDFPKRFVLSVEDVELESLPYAQYLIIANELELPQSLRDKLTEKKLQNFANLKL